MPPYTLLPCTSSDIPEMHRIYTRAFAGSYLNTVLFGNCEPEGCYAWNRDRLTRKMSLPEIHHFKMVDEETGKMVAWARWGHPLDSLPADQREARQAELAAGKLPAQDSEVPTKKGGDLGAAPPGADAQACEDFFGTLDKMQAKYVNFETDYLLHLIATDPGYQGLGLGTTLIQIGLRLADEGKREAYLEGSEKGLSLYKKLGWREVDSIWGGGEPRFTVMIREPQG